MTAEPIAFIGTSDLAGLLRGKSVPLAELPSRMGRGVGITPSNLPLSALPSFGAAGDLMPESDPATRRDAVCVTGQTMNLI